MGLIQAGVSDANLQVGTQGPEMPAACSRSQCLEIENLGFKPAGALGGEAEKADEVGLRGQSPVGAQLAGTGEGQE